MCECAFKQIAQVNLCISKFDGTSLAVQWLGLHASNAGSVGSIPVPGTKIPHAAWHGQKIKRKNF